jgi:PadR family transcriptional regulator, regulatory protein PadR
MAEPRMTLQALTVLSVMLDEPLGRHYGLEISKRAGLPTGSIYPILARLEKLGWLCSEFEQVDPSEAGRPPRRFYQLTAIGERSARQKIQEARRSLAPLRTSDQGMPAPGTA